MERILVIGLGNPHRCDDGFGFHAAERLQTMVQEEAVTIIPTQELKPELSETISQAGLVIFLDAAVQGTPGTVMVTELAPAETHDGLFSHDLTPARILTAAQVIFGRCPEAMHITVAGENFGFCSHLSPAVEAALPRVFERISDIIISAKDREPVRMRPHLVTTGT